MKANIVIGMIITPIINNEEKISFSESGHLPCSEIYFISEVFNPKFANIFRFPITDTIANTPYNSTPNLLIKTGIHIKVSSAVIISCTNPLRELFINVFLVTIIISVKISD